MTRSTGLFLSFLRSARLFTLVSVFLISGVPVWSATFQVFKKKETVSVNGKQETIQYPYGFYATGLLTSPDYEELSEALNSFRVSVSKNRGSSAEDSFETVSGPGYFLYMPAHPVNDPDTADLILELANVFEEHGIKSGQVQDPARDRYLLTMPSIDSGDFSFDVAPDLKESLGVLHRQRLRLRALTGRKRTLEAQLGNYRRYKPVMLSLLKRYKTFRDLYQDMINMEPAITTLMANPNQQVQFKTLIDSYFETERYLSEFQMANRDSQTRKFPNRYLNYNQLFANTYSRPADASIQMLQKYLLVLNFVFLNPDEFQDFSDFCVDPFAEITTLRVVDYSLAMERDILRNRMSATIKGQYSLINFMSLDGLFVFELTNQKGIKKRFAFDSSRPAFDIERLRNSEPLIVKDLTSVNGSIARLQSEIKENPANDVYGAQGTDIVEADYWIAQNAILAAGANAHFANVHFLHGDAVRRLTGRPPAEETTGIRKKFPGNQGINLHSVGDKWFIVGPR